VVGSAQLDATAVQVRAAVAPNTAAGRQSQAFLEELLEPTPSLDSAREAPFSTFAMRCSVAISSPGVESRVERLRRNDSR